jgi:hypothetical protein
VADALIVAIGPSRARPSSGRRWAAQLELYGPITATTRNALEYARALLRQVAGVHGVGLASPVRTLESSHDWYPTVYRPARKSRRASTKRIASVNCRGCRLLRGTWRGRSDTIRTSGAALPANSTGVQNGSSTAPPKTDEERRLRRRSSRATVPWSALGLRQWVAMLKP